MSGEGNANLLILGSFQRLEIEARLQAALQSTCRTLYVFFKGYSEPSPDADLLTLVAHIFDAVAVEKPCLNLVPLLPFAGWTAEKVAGLDDIVKCFASKHDFTGLNIRPSIEVQSFDLDSQPSSQSSWTGHQSSQVEVEPSAAILRFQKVAVGGTFDRLHAGHRSLLAITALVSADSCFVGITGDQLLINKEHKELLEPYDQRKDAVISYLKAVRPHLNVAAGPLLDPKARTMAATDEGMQALIVSQETIKGGKDINADRKSQGLEKLALIIINLVGLGSKALDGEKLSSTALRKQEAEAKSHRIA